MYGTRRAGLLWGETFAVGLVSKGFCRGKRCGQIFWHLERDICLVCHGDDTLAEGASSDRPGPQYGTSGTTGK